MQHLKKAVKIHNVFGPKLRYGVSPCLRPTVRNFSTNLNHSHGSNFLSRLRLNNVSTITNIDFPRWCNFRKEKNGNSGIILQSLIASAPTKNAVRFNIVRTYSNDVTRCSSKPKKLVGYWLLGCSGMVFVAVALGVTLYYGIIFYSIAHVIEEALKRIRPWFGEVGKQI